MTNTDVGPLKDSPAGLLNRAYTISGLLHEPEQAVIAAREAAGVAGRARDHRRQAKALALLVGSLVDQNRYEEALHVLKERHSILLALGKKGLAEAEQKLGLLLYGKATRDAHSKLLCEQLETAARHDDPDTLVAIAMAQTVVLWQAGEIEEAVELARISARVADQLDDAQQRIMVIALVGSFLAVLTDQQSLEEAAQCLDEALDGYPGNELSSSHLASALRARAQVYGRTGCPAQGVPFAHARADLCVAVGAHREAFDSYLLSAALASDADDDTAAVGYAQAAVDLAERLSPERDGINPLREVSARVSLGRYQLWAGDAATALTTFQDAGAAQGKLGAPAEIQAETLMWAGRAARTLQDDELARHYWASAIDAVGGTEGEGTCPEAVAAAIELAQSHLAARAMLPGNAKVHASHGLNALSAVEWAVTSARSSGYPQLLIQALEVSGRARAEIGDECGLAELEEALALAQQYGMAWLAADVRDSRGRALMALGRIADAVPVLIAADEYAAAGDTIAAAMAELVVGRGLIVESRLDDAFAAYGACLNRLPRQCEQYRGVCLEYAHVLDAHGHVEAASALRATLSPKGA